MRIAKCKLCNKPFQSHGFQFCPNCMQELDEKYKLVRDFLYDNPNATIEEVVEATEVPQKIILYYLRDGRLSMVNASGFLRCEQCGTAINSGRFCEGCMAKVDARIIKPMKARETQTRRAEIEEDGQAKMYTYQERIRNRPKL